MTIKQLYDYALEKNAENLVLYVDAQSIINALSNSEGELIDDLEVNAYHDGVVIGVHDSSVDPWKQNV